MCCVSWNLANCHAVFTFRMAAVRHFAFWNCISAPNFVKIGQTVAEISRFLWFSTWRPPPCWIFTKICNFYERSPVGGQYMSQCQISSKSVIRLQRYGYLTVFKKWWSSAILDLLGAYWDHPRRPLDSLRCCAKFGRNWCRSFDNMKLSIFCPSGLKTPIHAPKLGFSGDFTPKMRSNVNKTPKRHIYGS